MIDEKNIGSSLEDFLREEGQLEEARQVATKRVLAWRLDTLNVATCKHQRPDLQTSRFSAQIN